MVASVQIGVLLAVCVAVRRLWHVRMVGEMGIGRVVRHAGSRGRSIMKPAQQQDEQHQEAERSAGHPRAPNSE